MNTRRRLTREESREVARTRLIEAAEPLFIRSGFDDASIEEISETAGYSRAGFYPKFDDKQEPEWEQIHTDAAKLVFDRMTGPKSLIEDKSQC